MAIDAGPNFLQALMHILNPVAALLVEVHRFVGVAAASFPRIGRLHRRHDLFRQFEPIRFSYYFSATGVE